ncbi:MAG: pilus assembly protein PilM [Candidatus Zapsychrus exili]|nr:pilus assembly protein PilM [Candidatus Zapsychrus exili]
MTANKQLGIFWGDDKLSFSEIYGTSFDEEANKSFSISYKRISIGGLIEVEDQETKAEETKLVESIKNTLAQKGIDGSSVKLSLPTRDIILRSFVVPWVPQNEMKRVVEFEANKYLPFPLSELSYSFQSLTITQKGNKLIRIIFAAIKKDALNKYQELLERAGLGVDVVEPDPISLIRMLTHQDLIPKNEAFALVVKESSRGKIIIIDQGIPQFIRDFQLRIKSSDNEEISPDFLTTRFVNEIHVSLDYFNRMGSQQNIKSLKLICFSNSENTIKALEENLDIPITKIENDTISTIGQDNIDFLNSYGASLFGLIDTPSDLNLSEKKLANKSATIKELLKNIDYKTVLPIIAGSIALIIVSSMMSNFFIKKINEKFITLKEKLGIYENASVEIIESKNNMLREQLDVFKNIRVNSEISLFLREVPKMLPEGAWIKDFNIAYVEKTSRNSETGEDVLNKSKPKIGLNGYVHKKNTNEQFKIANKFLSNLKRNKEFSSQFEEIELQSAKAEKLEQYELTSFEINCK